MKHNLNNLKIKKIKETQGTLRVIVAETKPLWHKYTDWNDNRTRHGWNKLHAGTKNRRWHANAFGSSCRAAGIYVKRDDETGPINL